MAVALEDPTGLALPGNQLGYGAGMIENGVACWQLWINLTAVDQVQTMIASLNGRQASSAIESM